MIFFFLCFTFKFTEIKLPEYVPNIIRDVCETVGLNGGFYSVKLPWSPEMRCEVIVSSAGSMLRILLTVTGQRDSLRPREDFLIISHYERSSCEMIDDFLFGVTTPKWLVSLSALDWFSLITCEKSLQKLVNDPDYSTRRKLNFFGSTVSTFLLTHSCSLCMTWLRSSALI